MPWMLLDWQRVGQMGGDHDKPEEALAICMSHR